MLELPERPVFEREQAPYGTSSHQIIIRPLIYCMPLVSFGRRSRSHKWLAPSRISVRRVAPPRRTFPEFIVMAGDGRVLNIVAQVSAAGAIAYYAIIVVSSRGWRASQ